MKAWKVLTAAVLSFAPLISSAALIDFEGDSDGSVANGFTSTSDAGVHFSDTIGAELTMVSGIGECAGTRCLAAFDDFDSSGIQIDFDFAVNALSFDYGNDQVFGDNPATQIMVQFFLSSVAVGTAFAGLNFDDIMNQTFLYVGSAFDRAIVTYVAGDGSAATLIETIDNIQYRAVPEPYTVALFGLGMLLLGRRRKV